MEGGDFVAALLIAVVAVVGVGMIVFGMLAVAAFDNGRQGHGFMHAVLVMLCLCILITGLVVSA